MMTLEEVRKKIDACDDKIASAYAERMELVKTVAEIKKQNGLATENTERERSVLNRVTAPFDDGMKLYVKQVFEKIFDTAKAFQTEYIHADSPVREQIVAAVKRAEKFPVSATVACQGIAGAYSQKAADKLFPLANIMFFRDWNAVFGAVEKGLCSYGVLPIENSTAGSVNGVYDLMQKHKCYITRAVKLRVSHALLACDGTEIKDVKEIVSHEQALNQCAEFIKTLGDVKLTRCDNTALAAKLVSEKKEKGVACICDKSCAGIYGLKTLATEIQTNSDNYTRFIAVSKNLQIFDGAKKISVLVNLPHETGSLNKLLNRFSTIGLNLTKLESRPIGSSPFEFAFYFDFEADVREEVVLNLLSELEKTCDRFVFLGGYEEIM